MWAKKILTKICPKIRFWSLRSSGAPGKPFFGNLNSKPRGGHRAPPVTGGPLRCVNIEFGGQKPQNFNLKLDNNILKSASNTTIFGEKLCFD